MTWNDPDGLTGLKVPKYKDVFYFHSHVWALNIVNVKLHQQSRSLIFCL